MARSFKYHRPRGILTAGSEEPNALVTTGHGASSDPNLRATVQEIYEGMEAKSQNRWPSLGFDVLAVNDLAAPFLSAGFYYKTFMWPRAFWERIYEPIIRRAAGLGSLSGKHDEGVYEKAFAFCDVLVIGGGPAGPGFGAWAARLALCGGLPGVCAPWVRRCVAHCGRPPALRCPGCWWRGWVCAFRRCVVLFLVPSGIPLRCMHACMHACMHLQQRGQGTSADSSPVNDTN